MDIREQQEIALSLVKAGDVLRVLPGASVPTDGVVLEGQSYVGEAMLTGEAMPVHKGPGDAVLGAYVVVSSEREGEGNGRAWDQDQNKAQLHTPNDQQAGRSTSTGPS